MRAHDAEAELSETRRADLTLATLGEMAAPSLFSTTRCVVVRGAGEPSRRVRRRACWPTPPPRPTTSRLVLVHGGGQKGSGVLTKLRKLGP